MASSNTNFGVWNNAAAGDHAIDGTRWIQTQGSAAGTVTRTLVFSGFAKPLGAFGLWVTDFEAAGALSLSINGAAAQSFTILASGSGRDAGDIFLLRRMHGHDGHLLLAAAGHAGGKRVVMTMHEGLHVGSQAVACQNGGNHSDQL